MNTKRIRFFVQAIRSGSFTQAAEALGCSQSAVSQMVSGLEEELGLKLMKRSRSGIRLTAEGELLLPEMEAILEHERKLEALVEGLRGGETGEVVVASFSSVAVHWLPAILREFGKMYPNVSLRLNTGDYHDVAQWLADGSAGVGFVNLPFDGACSCIPLYQDRLLAVLPRDHPMAHRERFPVEQVGREDFISLLAASDHDARRYLESQGVKPNIRFSTKDDYAILAMVESGLGMSIVPELLLKGEKADVCTMELEPQAFRTIGIALTEQGKSSPAAAAFAAFAQSWIQENWVQSRDQTT